MNKAPFVFVSGTCKFSIPVDGEDAGFRGYFAGRYQTAVDLGEVVEVEWNDKAGI